MSGVQYIDVCNGDADGLCAVLQWRLHAPRAATLVTGLKREIALLERVQAAAGDQVLVCDISMQRNRTALLRLLEQGVQVRYFDHHAVADIPVHPGLEAHIDLGSGVCSSLLMDRHLGGAFRAWALVGAYGDNLTRVADALAIAHGFAADQRQQLRALGEAINYNAYGEDERDVHITPARLYGVLSRYSDPLALWAQETIGQELDALRQADLRRAAGLKPHWQGDTGVVYLLPDEPWSRRVSGGLANELARAAPKRACAVVAPTRAAAAPGEGYRVSVRAPIDSPAGASELCARFGGLGRAAAAGIDHLPAGELGRFVQAFGAARWGVTPGRQLS